VPAVKPSANDAGGQALVEFALVAPIFFILVFGVLQLGLLFGAQNGLVDGVRDTARQAATYRVNEASITDPNVFPTICSTLETQLLNELHSKIPGFNPLGPPLRYHPTIQYEWQQYPDTTQYFLVVDVTVTYDHPLFVPLIAGLINPGGGGSLSLTAHEQMRVENPSLTQPSSTTAVQC
jgi:Flp pilus assembly protein TadG